MVIYTTNAGAVTRAYATTASNAVSYGSYGTATTYATFSWGDSAARRVRTRHGLTNSTTGWSVTDAWDTCDTTTSTNGWGWVVNRPGTCGWDDEECEFSITYSTYGDYVVKRTPEEQAAYDAKVLKERIQKTMRERCGPNIILRDSTKRQPLAMPSDIREQRARETLRRVIGDSKFLNFVKNGFISVKAKSGLVYQIFTGHGITHVFDQGNLVERLCVVLQGNFPPTDSLIMRYLLILNNEQQFRSFAVKHSVQGHQAKRSHPQHGQEVVVKPLAEIFKELKAKQAA